MRFIVFFMIIGFQYLAYSNTTYTINDKDIKSFNTRFDVKPAENETIIYGVISLKCPCSRDSLTAFQEVQHKWGAKTKLVVFDIGATNEEVFLKIKRSLNPSYDLRYDPSKSSVDLFKTRVTPSAYILKNNQILYQAAVIDPGKNPSPNYLNKALGQIMNNKTAEEKQPFGCMIEK